MKRIIAFIMVCMTTYTTFAQGINIKDLTSRKYAEKRIYGIVPMNDGTSYTQLSSDYKRIVKYSFKDGKEIATLFNVETARGKKLKNIDGYTISEDGTKILLQTETRYIYRHSKTAVYYIYNVGNNKIEPLSDGGPLQNPIFSKDGNQVAFVRGGNLFLVKLLFNNSESQITKDGKFNCVINGLPDWVNEEEFANDRSFEFSPDGTMIAWIRYDETKVPLFSFPVYSTDNNKKGGNATYPGEYSYKYPVAGEVNSTVTVHTYDIKSHTTKKMDVPMDSDSYIPRIHFATDNKLAILTLNRRQDLLNIYMANPRSTVCQLIYTDNTRPYINEGAYTDIDFKSNSFVIMSEKSGFNHIYVYNLNGGLIRQATKGSFDVTSYCGYDENTGNVYYQSNEGSPLIHKIYRSDKNGKVACLTPKGGCNDALFSSDFKYFINVYSDLNTPSVTTINDANGKTVKTLIDNAELKSRMQELSALKEKFTFTTSEGVTLNGLIIKPRNFNPNHKYPVVLFQYSGPGSQKVLDSWGIGGFGCGGAWESILADKGIISVIVDGRGTGGRGAEFEKCTYLHLGVKEARDQVETALWLQKQPFIDADNIGIWGWSFGGFTTLMAMSEGTPVFKCGVAVAPPTSWRFYDTVYTERYMRTPKENNDGYNDADAMNRIDKLHGNLLICHGLADDNVHYRNTAEYAYALVDAGKQFDMQVYTNRNHSIVGGNTRQHLMNKILNFLTSNLK